MRFQTASYVFSVPARYTVHDVQALFLFYCSLGLIKQKQKFSSAYAEAQCNLGKGISLTCNLLCIDSLTYPERLAVEAFLGPVLLSPGLDTSSYSDFKKSSLLYIVRKLSPPHTFTGVLSLKTLFTTNEKVHQ